MRPYRMTQDAFDSAQEVMENERNAKFPITHAKYDDGGRRITPRMYRVAAKKRFVLAIAAIMYRKTHNYAETWRLLKDCLGENMQIRITENWLRVKLKRLGLGMSPRHKGEFYDYNGWRVTRLDQESYKSYDDGPGEIAIVSHHHANGAAFEVNKKSKCFGCEEVIPPNLYVFDKLIKLRRKIS